MPEYEAICPVCRGCGKGQTDLSKCPECHGTGSVMVEEPEEEAEFKAEEDEDDIDAAIHAAIAKAERRKE